MDKNDIFDLIFDDKSVKPKSNRRAKVVFILLSKNQ